MPTTITGTDGVSQVQAGAVESGDLPAGSVIQVVQSVKTDTFSTTNSFFTNIPGLSVSITPNDPANKILVMLHITFSTETEFRESMIRMLRDGSLIYAGDSSGDRSRVSAGSEFNDEFSAYSATPVFLDSPNTTSLVTYSCQTRSGGSNASSVINRTGDDGNRFDRGRYASSITAMEIAG